jgi:NAD(P)-dependent dehydrogenase (short-subunit alcohol dehydrogenase family)
MQMNVLITGASGNLGKVVTDKFLEAGYQVFAIVSSERSVPDLPKSVKNYQADLRSEASAQAAVAKIIQEHGRIDVAILLAGGFAMGNIAKTPLAAIHDMIALNFDTAYSVTQPVFNQMTLQKSGKFILIGARPAMEHRGGKEMIAYSLSKTLIIKLAELLNADGKDKGITASVLIPGTIDTPTNREAMPNADRSTWVTPDELAESMLYLISENGKSLRETVLKFYGNG